MKEIGSEYWNIDFFEKDNNLEYLKIGQDYKLLMSGRTAIDYILNEIDDNMKIVYMPNYCCESMIQPFVDNGYKIEYYKVDIINKKYDIDLNFKCSIFFGMSYFGYSASVLDNYIDNFSKKNIIVLEDITHRFLNVNNYCNSSDYLVCSLRKWFSVISGGIAVNLRNKFKSNLSNYSINQEFLDMRIRAMQLKRQYMENENIDKNQFLKIYNKSNEMIKNYKNMKIDDLSISILKHLNIDEIRNRRINNSKIIQDKLINNKNINLIYKLQPTDCPLFVPISLKNRDKIKKELIKNNIYLPVHWPNSNTINNEIYNIELSLINDQRYNEEDIIGYINKLIEIVGD